MESLEYILRAKLHPFLDNVNNEKVDKLEKELELFEYSNMKERIIGERFLAQLEQDKKNDEDAKDLKKKLWIDHEKKIDSDETEEEINDKLEEI